MYAITTCGLQIGLNHLRPESQQELVQIVVQFMQSDRNNSNTDTFHEPTTYEPHI